MLRNSEPNEFISAISGKRVLYVATKNSDYIRIKQEERLVKEYASDYTIIDSEEKKYFRRCLSVFKQLLFTNCKTYDVVMIGFMAQMIVPLFYFKFRKTTVIVDFFISIFDTLVDDRKKFRSSSIPARVVHYIDKLTLQKADIVISDTTVHGDYFAKEFNVERSKILTMYLEADSSVFGYRNTEKPVELRDKYVVLYFGSILPLQGINVVLDAIALAEEREKDLYFIVIGPIKNKYNVVPTANAKYIEWLEYEELASYISFSDLCLAGHFSDSIGKANRTIPGKAYIYESIGKRMVLGNTEANRELFSESARHLFVDCGSATKLLDVIIQARNSGEELRG